MAQPPKEIDGFKIPEWWECGWRRVPCGRDDCRLCGKIAKQRRKHIEKGENPDDLESIFEDVGETLDEVFQMLERDLKKWGIQPEEVDATYDGKDAPDPEFFPLCHRIDAWRFEVIAIMRDAFEEDELWVNSKAAADLLWYSGTLSSKTYRELANVWEIQHGDQFGNVDYQYTKFVIQESLRILEESFRELTQYTSPQKVPLMVGLQKLLDLRSEILKI